MFESFELAEAFEINALLNVPASVSSAYGHLKALENMSYISQKYAEFTVVAPDTALFFPPP